MDSMWIELDVDLAPFLETLGALPPRLGDPDALVEELPNNDDVVSKHILCH